MRGGTNRMVEYELNDGVATITISRPEVYNALNFETLRSLRSCVEEIHHDRSCRVVLITGSGNKAFCSGADLKERATLSENEVRKFIYMIRETFTAIEKLPMPVIAVINGLALGGGTELALACDLRIASEEAVLGLTETSLAIIPGAGGTQRLARLIGPGRAKELIFLARRIPARESLGLGLINRIVSMSELMPLALEWANEIKLKGPIAITQAKFAINLGSEVDLATALSLESKAYEVCIPTKDRLEGLAAFKEKRQPKYIGE